MNINKIAGALALIATLVTSSAAQANIIEYRNPSGTTDLGFLTSATLANDYEIILTSTNGTPFTNVFQFSIGTNSTVTAATDNILTSYSITKKRITTTTTLTDINNLEISLYNSLDSSAPVIVTSSNDGKFLMSTGTYFAKVTGTTAGDNGGWYSITMSAEPAAVPVPAAVWLLGSGLIGLVAVARRKEQA